MTGVDRLGALMEGDETTTNRRTVIGLARVNLLPPEIEKARQLRRIQAGLGGVVALAVVLVCLVYLAAVSSVGSAQEQLDDQLAQQAQIQQGISGFAGVKETYAKAEEADTVLSAAMGQEVRWSQRLTTLGDSIPASTWLTDMTVTQTVDGAAAAPAAADPLGALAPGLGTVSFTGKGVVIDDVADWLDSVAAQPGHTNAYISNAAEEQGEGTSLVTFASTVTLTEEALSHRFDSPGPVR